MTLNWQWSDKLGEVEQKTISKEAIMEIERGDIWFAELSQGSSVQTEDRPVLVIQNDIGNRYSPNVIVIPITSQIKETNMPTHVLYKLENKRWCMILAEQICTISKEQLQFKIEKLNEYDMKNVDDAIKASLGL